MNQSRLKELLHYDPDTGIFTRLKCTANRQKVGEVVGVKMPKGYLKCRIDSKEYTLHRLAFLYIEGKLPKDSVDHINHIKTDNRWANLRHADQFLNSQNMSKSSRNSSGIVGVFWDKSRDRWVANLRVNKVNLLKRFKDKDAAIAQRKTWNLEYGIHPNHGS